MQNFDKNNTLGPLNKDKFAETTVNHKYLNGGAHPDKRSLAMNQIIIDPDKLELDELGNPLDYFNIYKRKM
jgi:hypothetical protein